MKISEGGRRVVLLKEWTMHCLSWGFGDQTKEADAHFLVNFSCRVDTFL